jgi:hypothetical protein
MAPWAAGERRSGSASHNKQQGMGIPQCQRRAGCGGEAMGFRELLYLWVVGCLDEQGAWPKLA